MFFVIAWSRLDPDFGWHLTTGNYILAHHKIPRHDLYTYTAKGHSWVDHEWGSDVILALTYHLGGYLLSAVLFALIWASAIMLIGWKLNPLVLLAGSLAMLPYAGIRPIAWSVLGFAICLKLLSGKLNSKLLWLIPILFAVWANLHAGFIAGLALIAYFAFVKRNRKLLLILVVSAAATLANAYGINLYGEVAHTLFDPAIHNQIVEWRTFYILAPSWPYVLLWFLGFVLYKKISWRKLYDLGLLLFLTVLSASRNMPFFVIGTIPIIGTYWHYIRERFAPQKRSFISLLFEVAVLMIAICLISDAIYVAFFPYTNRLSTYPVQAVAYLKKNPCSGNLFNSYNYGGYLIWQLPKEPVYIDGRMVTWIGHMDTYLSIVNHPASNYPGQFKKYDIRCALLQNTARPGSLVAVLEANHWIDKVHGNGSILLLKPDTTK
jgi:hypothetical protein